MRTLNPQDIQPGSRFHGGLYSRTGQKLLRPGATLTHRQAVALQRAGDNTIYEADDIDELIEAGILERFDPRQLSIGRRSPRNVLSRAGHLVLKQDQPVESHHVDALHSAGALEVKKQEAAQRRQRTVLADALATELLEQAGQLKRRVATHAAGAMQPEADETPWPSERELIAARHLTVERLRSLFAALEAGTETSITAFEQIINPLTNQLAKHPRQFTQLALLCPRKEDYLPDHAYTVTVLAMAIGAQLGWDQHAVQEVALASLLADLGMLMLPQRIRRCTDSLTDVDRAQVNRHPVFSLALMEPVQTLTPIVQLAAVQHHEREDGQGYPRGLRSEAICDYARVIAVADSFAAMTEPRRFRRRLLPYTAMENVLYQAAENSLWLPAAKALVQAAGLFPVGSFVKLSNSDNARILAANPEQTNRPTICPLDRNGDPASDPIDLAAPTFANLHVIRPIQGPTG